MAFSAQLQPAELDGLELLVDPGARAEGVLVAFSDRRGGVSRPPYDSLNLAVTSGDDPSAVIANRARVEAILGAPLALARQAHGAGVLEAEGAGVLGEADVLVARRPGVAPAVLTADWAPVVVLGRRGVAVAHAGWRGLVAGAIEAALDEVGPAEAAWVGPAIRACCYTVGSEVTAAFTRRGLPVAGPGRVDVSDAALALLRRAGVANVARAQACTYHEVRYFSHRRDGVTGRQGAFAVLLEERS